MILRSSHARCHLLVAISCLLALCACCVSVADTAGPDADSMMPDPDEIIRRILGVDDMARNVCLIGSHQMVNAADLPGRLIAISPERNVPSDLLRYSFRKPGVKGITQVNPPTNPIQVTRLESSQAQRGSLLNWFGLGMGKEDIAELRTVPLPATSISVDDLDETAITERFSTVPAEVRRGLGIITDVIPYEVWAAVCKKITGKAEAGIWYIRLGRDTYSKQTDEIRKYYLVAVYTPIVFYDDIGVIPAGKTSHWLPDVPVKNRSETLSLWLKERPQLPERDDFARERAIGWIDSTELQQQCPPGCDPNGGSGSTTDGDSGQGITTVVPK